MNKTLEKITKLTMALGAVSILAGCAATCDGEHPHDMHRRHYAERGAQQPEMVMYEAEAVEVVAMEPMAAPMMVATMHTRNGNGGTTEMGHIKFAPSDNGAKMMVDVTDLRPGKDYTMHIYPCGNCSDYSCCASKSMNVRLPMLSVNEPGRLTKTYTVRGVNCQKLNNAKIVLTRDGGYKASWGRIQPTGQWQRV